MGVKEQHHHHQSIARTRLRDAVVVVVGVGVPVLRGKKYSRPLFVHRYHRVYAGVHPSQSTGWNIIKVRKSMYVCMYVCVCPRNAIPGGIYEWALTI